METQQMRPNNEYFDNLLKVDLSEFSSQKNGLLYIQWSRAWSALKSAYPLSYMTVYENENGWNYFTDGKTCWVKVGITVVFDDRTSLEQIEYLAIMNHRNQSIPLDQITSTNVINSIQRCATKAIARHGAGLSVYYGEEISAELNEVHETNEKELVKLRKEISTLGSALISKAKVDKNVLYDIIKKHNDGSADTKQIKSTDVCNQIIEELKALAPAQATEKKTTATKPAAAKTTKAKATTKTEE